MVSRASRHEGSNTVTARVLILSGDHTAFTRLFRETFNCQAPDVTAFEEKAITRPAFVRRLVREQQADILCFATKRLDLQRFQFLLAWYLLVGRARHRLILDETGRTLEVTWPRFVFLSLPWFLVEAFASTVVLAASTVRLAFLTARFRRKGAR